MGTRMHAEPTISHDSAAQVAGVGCNWQSCGCLLIRHGGGARAGAAAGPARSLPPPPSVRGGAAKPCRARHPPCEPISLMGVTNLRGKTPPSASLAADPKPCTPPPPRRRPAWPSSAPTPATSTPTPCHKTSPCPRLCRQAPQKPRTLFPRRLTPASPIVYPPLRCETCGSPGKPSLIARKGIKDLGDLVPYIKTFREIWKLTISSLGGERIEHVESA